MPPKRKSVKRKISTSATTPIPPPESAPSPSLQPPAKKQRVTQTPVTAPVSRTTRARSTRSGTQLETPALGGTVNESSASGNLKDTQPAANGDAKLQTSTPPQVSSISQVLAVPEIPKVSEAHQATKNDETPEPPRQPQDDPTNSQRPSLAQPLDPDATLETRQAVPNVQTTQLAHSSQPHASVLSAPPVVDGTPSKRTPSRRPPIFSEAMKREQERLEAEAQAAKDKEQREQVQRESDMLEGNADAEQDSVTPSARKTPTSDLMMNVLNRPRQETQQASSPTVKEDITKRPFDLERYANHPLPALRQAYKDIKMAETFKAEAQREMKRSEAADRALKASNWNHAAALLRPPPTLPSERAQANVAREGASQVSSGARTEQQPVPAGGSLPTSAPSPSIIAPTPANIATPAAGSKSTIKQTTIKPIAAQPVTPTSVPDPIEPAVQQPVTEPNDDITPREAIQRLSPEERLKKREELTKRLKEIELEIRLLDEETERVNAAGRAGAFKQVLDQHLHELNTGVRTYSPYFPQYGRPSQLAAGLQVGPFSAPASAPAAGSASTPASATAAAQSSLPPLFRSMPTHGHPPIHPNQLLGKTHSQPAARPVSPVVGSVTGKELLAKWDKAPAPLSKSKSIPPKAPTANPPAPARFTPKIPPAQMAQHARLSQSLSAARGASPAAGQMGCTPQASTVTQKKDVAPSKRGPVPTKGDAQPPQQPPAIAPTPVRPLGRQPAPSSASSHLHRSLPPDKKAAITEPPRTDTVSPYGHLLADAPETSALLAELESLTSGAGTPVPDAKPSSGARGGYQFPSSAYSMPGTGSPSFPGVGQPSSSAYHHSRLGVSAMQPLSSRPTSVLTTPRPSASTQTVDKGKSKAKSPTKVKTPRSKAKLLKEPEEKRLANRRNKCPVAVQERADRVREQRMCIVHRERDVENLKETINILGSTGNVYTVEFGKLPTCTCPDFFKGNHCKHIIFVALKVLRMPQFGDLWYQKAYLESELRQIFASAPPNAFDSVVAPANVQKAFREHLGLEPASTEEANKKTDERDDQGKRKPGEGDECPICADEMTVDGKGVNELVYDLGAGGCGQALHKQCFQMWAAQEKTKGKKATCVYCRHEWAHTSSGGSGKGPEFDMADGYLNMASLAGLSRERDTSSYYSGPSRRGKSYWGRRRGCAYDDDW